MKLFNRPFYSQKIKPYIGKGLIKVLTGQRRVGKSYIMLQIMNEIAKENASANIIWINKEKSEFSFIRNDQTFSDYVSTKLITGKDNFLFVDEIQEIEGFENVLRSLQANNDCDIFCTGSNANLLSGELPIPIQTISFSSAFATRMP